MQINNKSVFIKVRKLNSAYSTANKKPLMDVDINRTIGASIRGVNKMLANPEEQKIIMQDIIAISPNSGEWNKELTNYWNSFSYDIPENGKELEIGFIYDINDLSKKPFIESINKGISIAKDKLESDNDLRKYIDNRLKLVIDDFKKSMSAAGTIKDVLRAKKAFDAAYDIKYKSIETIERERYKVGRPIEAFDYMLYRYCLVYSDVANEPDLTTKSPRIRFYLHSSTDIKLAKDNKVKDTRVRTKLLLEVTESVEDIENFLYAIGEASNIPEDDSDKYLKVEKLSISRADDFLRIARDKDLNIVGTIEKYISAGIFNRFEGSKIIYDATNMDEPLGNTIEEVVKYFKATANKAMVADLKTRYKNLGN